MIRQAKASSVGSTSGIGGSRGPLARVSAVRGRGDDNGSGVFPGWLRLGRLAAITVAFLLVPVAVATADPLTVTLSGSAQGTVVSTPPGIDCSNVGGGPAGPSCTASFGFFANVQLKATGDNSVLAGWTGNTGGTCDSGFVNPCGYTDFFNVYNVQAAFEPPPDPPIAITDPAGAGFNDQIATLHGRINPNGSAVGICRFEYGATSSYGQTTTCDQSLASLGTGNADMAVTASTEPLDPGTTYHYRLVSANSGGQVNGDDHTFTTPAAATDTCPNAAIRAAQGVRALSLPDCMALEMVSPPVKGQQFARFPELSASGNRVRYQSIAALADTPSRLSAFGDNYVATRTPSGWVTSPTTPRAPIFFGEQVAATGFTSEFSNWFHIGADRDDSARGFIQAFQGGVDGSFVPVSPALRPLNGTGRGVYVGSSVDRSHLYFKPPGNGNERDKKASSYLPGDPRPNGTGEDTNVYVTSRDAAGQPKVELLARDRHGKAWGGNCGARVGGMQFTSGTDLSLRNGERNQGAISADGSTVYFSTRPAQTEGTDCTEDNKMRIMQRAETPIGPAIGELFQSECARVSPPCSPIDGDDVYQGASVDQTRVYFNTTRQLADTDRDSNAVSCDNEKAVPGCDLYLYDSTRPAGERLTQVSAGDGTDPTPGEGANVTNAITAISADGSHVYFVAKSILTTSPNPEGAVAQTGQRNLYLYTYPAGKTSFVGILDPEDGGGPFPRFALYGGNANWGTDAYPVPIIGPGGDGDGVGGDGHVLVFRAKAALTADDGDSERDIFRYDGDAGTLERISKAGPGGEDDGAFEVTMAKGESIGNDYAETGRWASDDGGTIVFTTAEALLPGDVNHAEDSFMWRHGQLFRLPGSAKTGGSAEGTSQPTVDPAGMTVGFSSIRQLLPFDGDTVGDVYVARVDGGFPNPTAPPDCSEEACQGLPRAAPDTPGAGTVSSSGPGNVNPGRAKPKCGKHKVRKHGKCVEKRHHKKHQKKHDKGKRQRTAGGAATPNPGGSR